jgi:hypothetical protein
LGAKKLALGKEIFAKCFFSLLRVFYLALDKEASVPRVFSLPGVFYLALGNETNSRQSLGFR